GVGSVRIGASGLARDSGSGVFAGRGLREGECVAAVPLGACLCAGQGVDLAARLLREQALGGDSAFAPYVRQLPQAEQLASHPLLWPAGAAAASLLAPCPQASRMVRHCRMRASQEAAALVQAGAAETEEGARWALAIVESRSITLGDGSPERPLALALCPLLDLLNHQVPRQGQPPSCTVRENRETGAVELVASGATSEGSELWLEYERCSTAQIFARYGFVQRYPEGDAAGPSCLLPVPVGDPRLPGGAEAAAERLRLLRADGWRRSAWRPLLLKMPDHARSTGSLMPVARLCALPSATPCAASAPSCCTARASAPAASRRARRSWRARSCRRRRRAWRARSSRPRRAAPRQGTRAARRGPCSGRSWGCCGGRATSWRPRWRSDGRRPERAGRRGRAPTNMGGRARGAV
ncbi:unnamed protein product, partial [Prorocentrum cordatum]